jgi:outer membrane protein assembly factor BamB
LRNLYLTVLLTFVFLTVLPSNSGAAISEQLLGQAKLATVWQNAVSLNPKEKIQKITVIGDYLYILTDSNYLFCLDRNTGQLHFGIPVAIKNLPVSEPTVYNNTVYIVAANNLVAIGLQQGAELYRKKMSFSVSAPAAVNASHFYLAGMDKVLHVLDPNGEHENFKASADNKSVITSVLATDRSVFFATQGGNIICMDTSTPKRIWQFDAVGAIMTPLTGISDWLYASGKDTNLYKLSAGSGEKMWEFHAGSALLTSARATETVVYQYAQGKGLYAIDANSGKQLWLLADGFDLLAQDNDTAYILDKNNICTVMDNKQAKKTYTINFASVTSFAVNTYDSSIYIMEDKSISCIKPIKK